jgi:hypothetical protein
MEENPINAESTSSVRNYKWHFIIVLLMLLSLLVFFIYQSNKSSSFYGQETKKLNDKIQQLSKDNQSLYKELTGKSSELAAYMPYSALIKNLRLTDSAYASLPYRYGQQVYMMPDTAPVVINAISVTANQFEYAVKYVVRNKNGEYKTISISDLMKSTQ